MSVAYPFADAGVFSELLEVYHVGCHMRFSHGVTVAFNEDRKLIDDFHNTFTGRIRINKNVVQLYVHVVLWLQLFSTTTCSPECMGDLYGRTFGLQFRLYLLNRFSEDALAVYSKEEVCAI